MSVEQATGGPGWYPDPEEPGRQRWWDGTRWTEALARARRPWEKRPLPPQPTGAPLAHGPATYRAGLPGVPSWQGFPCEITFTTDRFVVDRAHDRLLDRPISDVAHVHIEEMSAQRNRGWTVGTGFIGAGRVVNATTAFTVYLADGMVLLFELPAQPPQAAAMTVQLRSFLARR